MNTEIAGFFCNLSQVNLSRQPRPFAPAGMSVEVFLVETWTFCETLPS